MIYLVKMFRLFRQCSECSESVQTFAEFLAQKLVYAEFLNFVVNINYSITTVI